MPQSENKLTDSGKLPDPELNPLLNPTLGQNLGRWAQVYFTNPPEKRDAAVLELLRELEGDGPVPAESAESQMAHQEFEQMRVEHLNADPANTFALPPETAVICPSCRQSNPEQQKFCGFCGAVLPGASTIYEEQVYEAPVTPLSESRELAEPAPAESDIDWLRNSAIAGFDPETEKQGGWWKYGLVGVLLLLAGFGYLEYVSRIPPKVVVTNSGAAQTSAAPPPAFKPVPVAANPNPPDHVVEKDIPPAGPTNTAPAAPAPVEPAPQPASAKPAPANNETATAGPETNAAYSEREIPKSATNSPEHTLDRAAAAPAVDNGAQELKQAQDFLEGRNVPHNSQAAARLLWKAVSKQNLAASLILADLYETGDGVPKSCDQARLLLVAASKKGSADAAGKLRSLESGGCRE